MWTWQSAATANRKFSLHVSSFCCSKTAVDIIFSYSSCQSSFFSSKNILFSQIQLKCADISGKKHCSESKANWFCHYVFYHYSCFHGAINHKHSFFCRSCYSCKQAKQSVVSRQTFFWARVNYLLSLQAVVSGGDYQTAAMLPLGLTDCNGSHELE